MVWAALAPRDKLPRMGREKPDYIGWDGRNLWLCPGGKKQGSQQAAASKPGIAVLQRRPSPLQKGFAKT